MRSRFPYFVLASALLHVALLGFPFSVTTGIPGIQAMLPVRVHLLTDGDQATAAVAERNGEIAPIATITEPKHDPPTSTPSPKVSSSTDESRPQTRSSAAGKHRSQRSTQRQDAPVKHKATPTKVALKNTPKVRTERNPQAKQEKQPNSPITKTANSSTQSQRERHQPTPLRTTTIYPGLGSDQPSGTDTDATNKGVKPVTGAQPAARAAVQNHPRQPGTFSRVRYARVVKPEYPEDARTQGWEGTTVLKVLVNRSGKSEKVRIQHTSGFNILDNAAVDALQRWEFHPARDEHKAVQSWVSVPVVFTLKEEQ